MQDYTKGQLEVPDNIKLNFVRFDWQKNVNLLESMNDIELTVDLFFYPWQIRPYEQEEGDK